MSTVWNALFDSKIEKLIKNIENNTCPSKLGEISISNFAQSLGAEAHAKLILKHRICIDDNKLAVAFAKALAKNKNVQVLQLSRGKSEIAIETLASALEFNNALIDLTLSHNNIGSAVGQIYASVLMKNSTLRSFDLRANKIGDPGAVALAQTLKQNNSLTSLDLSYNEIKTAGLKAIAEAIAQNHTLKELNLGGNQIREEEAKALANALEQNNTLQSLTLTSDQIGEAGAQAFLLALEQNYTLQYLYLGVQKYGYGSEIERKIDALLNRNKEFIKLNKNSNIHIKNNQIENIPDLKKIFEEQLNLAHERNSESESYVGWAYETGSGVESSHQEAIKWYQLAAEQGNAYALERLNTLGVKLISALETNIVASQNIQRINPFILNTEAELWEQKLKEHQATWQEFYVELKNQGHKTAEQQQQLDKIQRQQIEQKQEYLKQIRQERLEQAMSLGQETPIQRQMLIQAYLEQEQVLKECLEQQEQSFNFKINGLQRELQKAFNPEKDQALKNLQTEHALLMKEYRDKQQVLAEQRYIEQHEELRLFYRSTQVKLQELFLACKTLDSGMVVRDQYATKDNIAQGIQLAGDWLPLPYASEVLGIISKLVQRSSDKQEQNKAETIATLVINFSEIDKVTEQTARFLTQRYEEQLHCLTFDGAKLLGECGVKYMLSFMTGKQLKENEDLVHQLVGSVTTIKLHNGWWPKTHKNILTQQKNSGWNDNGIFKHPGIKTEHGIFFSGKDTKPQIYGYRFGTEQEAREANLTKTSHRVESSVHSQQHSQLSHAVNQQVKNITVATHAQSDQLEILQKQLQHEADARAKETNENQIRLKELELQREKDRLEMQALKQQMTTLAKGQFPSSGLANQAAATSGASIYKKC